MGTNPLSVENDPMERIRMLNRELAAANRRAAQRTDQLGSAAVSESIQTESGASDIKPDDWHDADDRLRAAS